MSRIASCLDAAAHFLLSRDEAIAILEGLLDKIIESWDSVCDQAGLAPTDRACCGVDSS